MQSQKSSGIGVLGTLFLVFLVLKLTGNIDWSWWWVTSPLWIPFALFLSLVVVISFFVFTAILLGVKLDVIQKRLEKFKK
jgi:hypothetical protein